MLKSKTAVMLSQDTTWFPLFPKNTSETLLKGKDWKHHKRIFNMRMWFVVAFYSKTVICEALI